MYDLIARPLSFFYSVWPSYAGSIVLLTLSIMVVLTPLTLKGTRSMLAMQRLQPELKRLQAKYKDDRQKLNEEMLKFYKENGINPVSGCLPLLLQMPVFFFLYRTLIGLTAHGPYGADMGSQAAATTRRAVFGNFGVFHPQHLDKSSRAVSEPHQHPRDDLLGDEPGRQRHRCAQARHRPRRSRTSCWCSLVAGTSYVQQKQVSGRNPQSAQVNPQQQMLLKLMPAFFAFISLGLPAGVVLYFFVSNLYRIGQQAFITRTMYADGGILSTTATEVDSSSKTKSQPAPERKGILGALRARRRVAHHRTPAQGQGAAQEQGPAQEQSPAQDEPAQLEGRVETGTGRRSGEADPTTRSGRVSPSGAQAGAAEDRAGEPTVGSRRAAAGQGWSGSERIGQRQGRWPVTATAGPGESLAYQEKEEVTPDMEWVETTARTVAEAKDAALDQLGVDEQEAEFEVLEEPRAGLFGRVRGEARVRARVAPKQPRPKVERSGGRRGKARSGRAADGPAGKAAGRGRGHHRIGAAARRRRRVRRR